MPGSWLNKSESIIMRHIHPGMQKDITSHGSLV